jgi:anti-anti-sigma factor
VTLGGSMVIEIEQYDGVCVLRCKGRFVSGRDQEYLEAKIEQIQRLNCKRVLADFREVQSIGSMGLTFIVAVYTAVVKDCGGRFVLAGALPFVRKALDLTKLSSVVSLAEDTTSGLAVLRGE